MRSIKKWAKENNVEIEMSENGEGLRRVKFTINGVNFKIDERTSTSYFSVRGNWEGNPEPYVLDQTGERARYFESQREIIETIEREISKMEQNNEVEEVETTNEAAANEVTENEVEADEAADEATKIEEVKTAEFYNNAFADTELSRAVLKEDVDYNSSYEELEDNFEYENRVKIINAFFEPTGNGKYDYVVTYRNANEDTALETMLNITKEQGSLLHKSKGVRYKIVHALYKDRDFYRLFLDDLHETELGQIEEGTNAFKFYSFGGKKQYFNLDTFERVEDILFEENKQQG